MFGPHATASEDLTTITIAATATFPAPEGGQVVVPAATYRVEATKDGHLRLVPTGESDAIVLACQEIEHETPLKQPVAVFAEGEQNDVHILLIKEDGAGWEAIGSAGEVLSRGTYTPLTTSTRTSILTNRLKASSLVYQPKPVDGNPTPAEGTMAIGGAADNAVILDISSVGLVNPAVIVHGPGLVFERVEGYGSAGTHNDQSGAASEMPIIFEYAGASEAALQKWYDDAHNPQVRKTCSIDMIIKRSNNTESFRWNLYEMYPEKISSGSDGKKRYELRTTLKPKTPSNARDDTAYRLIGTFGSDKSFNPNTDRYRVEISGVLADVYPQVAIDEADRKITLTFDYVESQTVYVWARNCFRGNEPKQDMSLISEQPPGSGTEVGRTNYFGVFPLRYQMISGFGQDIKTKQQLVLSYDLAEEG